MTTTGVKRGSSPWIRLVRPPGNIWLWIVASIIIGLGGGYLGWCSGGRMLDKTNAEATLRKTESDQVNAETAVLNQLLKTLTLDNAHQHQKTAGKSAR